MLLIVPLTPVVPFLAVIGGVVVLVTRVRPVVDAWHARGLVAAGRVALAAVALVALPGFASAIADILGRS